MTLPVSGAISFNDINLETNTTGTWQLSYDDERFRSLAGGSSAGSQVAVSAQYGTTFNGFYIYPNQTNSLFLTNNRGTRATCQFNIYIGPTGTISWSSGSGTTTGSYSPSRWFTPVTTSLASSYDFRVLQTGFTRTGTATNDAWNWQIDTNLFGDASGANFDTGWMTTKSTGYTIYYSQARVTPDGSFDSTSTGTIQFRAKATPGTVVSVPFTFRIYAA